MATTKAFNGLMQQFLDELSHVFMGDGKLSQYAKQFPLLCDANPKKPMEVFMGTYGPHMAKIHAKDGTLFDDVPVFLTDIDIQGLWSRCNDQTREAIWKYLQHLVFIATTVSLIPPEMLNAIEKVAMDTAAKCENGQINPAQIMNLLPQLLSSMPQFPQ